MSTKTIKKPATKVSENRKDLRLLEQTEPGADGAAVEAPDGSAGTSLPNPTERGVIEELDAVLRRHGDEAVALLKCPRLLTDIGAVFLRYGSALRGVVSPANRVPAAAQGADATAPAQQASDAEEAQTPEFGLVGLLEHVDPNSADPVDKAPGLKAVRMALAYEVRRTQGRLGAVREFLESFSYSDGESEEGERRAALEELAEAEDGLTVVAKGMERFLSLFHRSRFIALDEATFAKACAFRKAELGRGNWAPLCVVIDAAVMHLLTVDWAQAAGIVRGYEVERDIASRKAPEANKAARAAES